MHPALTYVLRDIGGSLWGVIVFALALFAPGYLLATATNIMCFRDAGLREKLAWSVLLSFGSAIITVTASVWLGGVQAGAVMLVVLDAAAAFVAYRRECRRRVQWRAFAPYLGLTLLLLSITVGSLVDVGWTNRLYMSVTAYDNALRTAFVEAALRTGVPPVSPVYWPGHNAPMHYYYFWYVVCAAVAKLAGISARQALIASSTWSLVGVIATLALFGRYLLGWRGTVLRKRWWTAVGLLTVTGLDGLVVLLYFLHTGTVARDIEWWSLDQVTSWVDTFLWVPHHAAGLVCCLLSILLLHCSMEVESPKKSGVLAAIAGLSFASGFGTSTYVAVGTALVVAVWAVFLCFGGALLKASRNLGIAACVAAAALAPYIVQLLSGELGANHGAGSALTFGLREMVPPVVLSGLPGLRGMQGAHPFLAKEIAALLLLVPGYFMELGTFAVALIFLQRQRGKTDGEKTMLLLSWAGLVSVTVVRSHVIAMNDYAARASLLPQFLLLLIAVVAMERATKVTRIFLLLFLIIGAGTSIYQIAVLRAYLPIHEKEGITEYEDLGHRNYVLRDAYDEMRRTIPASARVQFNVPNPAYVGFSQIGNVGRQIIVDDAQCNTSFGGEAWPCAGIESKVAKLFAGTPVVDAQHARELCKAIGADYLTAAKWDPVWQNKSGWAWTLPAIVVRPDVRVVVCSLSSYQAHQ